MDFLYPQFRQITHIINIDNPAVSEEYPTNSSFDTKFDYKIPANVGVAMVQESFGFECKWMQVKIIDINYRNAEYFNKLVYIKKENLVNVGGKNEFKTLCTKNTLPDRNAEEIDPNLKEVFVPYVDPYNGMYSVRIRTDYEKVLDSFMFENLLGDVLNEGVFLLLSSKGYKSDNQTIQNLLSTYYSFAYVNNDLDLTINRACEPLNFTVSIPLRFFDEFKVEDTPDVPPGPVTQTLTLINKSIRTEINKVISALTARSGDILQLTYPNRFINGFVIDFELAALRQFVNSANELFSIAGYPLNSDDTIQYELGLDDDFNLNSLTIISGENEPVKVHPAILSQMRMSAEFNSKRIFYYLTVTDEMLSQVQSLEILSFLQTYVKYPQINLGYEQVIVSGEVVPPEKVAKFRLAYASASEECINPSYLQSAAGDIIDIFSDPTFHLFIGQDKDKQQAPVPEKNVGSGIFSTITSIKQELQTYSKAAGNDGISLYTGDYGDGKILISSIGTGIVDDIKKTFQFNTNTLVYILNRLNVNKILFNAIFCYLKGQDPNGQNNEVIASTVAQLPADMVNYFNYYQQIKGFKGAEFARALNRGLHLDNKLFCIQNADVIYFVKGLAILSKTLNIVGQIRKQINATSEIASQILAKKVESPYIGFGKAIGASLSQAIIGLLFEVIRDLLTTSCEDGLFDRSPTQYGNPFDTTYVGSDTNPNKEPNSDSQKIKENRGKALDYVYYDASQYGFDREYVIDLLQLLFNDIICILTPVEAVQLLTGEPTELIITLVKNIIRGKYSSGDKDLSFLLEDENKLQLFFRQIGMTVDPYVLEQVTKVIINPITPSNICSPEQELARKELIENKIPKDLGVLDTQLRKRALKAKELLDKIQNGYPEIDFSPFCSDSQEANNATDYLIENYSRFLDDTFINILGIFNDESSSLVSAYKTEKNFIRRKSVSSGASIIGQVPYDLYNQDLGLNLSAPKVAIGSNTGTARSLFYPYSHSEISNSDIADSFLAPNDELQTANIVCPSDGFQADPAFMDMLGNLEKTRIFIEFVDADHLFDDNDRDSDLRKLWNKNNLGQKLSKLDYFIAITVNRDFVTQSDIEIKFIYVDKTNNRFTCLKAFSIKNPQRTADDFNRKIISYGFLEPILNDFKSGNPIRIAEALWALSQMAFSTKLFYMIVDMLTMESWDLSNDWMQKNEPSQVYGYDEQNNKYVYGITTPMFDRLIDDTKNLIQQLFIEQFLPIIKKIKVYENTIGTVRKFQEAGIFNIEDFIGSTSEDFTRVVNISAIDSNQNIKENEVFRFNINDPSVSAGYSSTVSYAMKYLIKYYMGKADVYCKSAVDTARDFIYVDKDKGFWSNTGDFLFGEDDIDQKLTSEEYDVLRNPDWTNDIFLKKYTKFNLMKTPKDQKYINCNVDPHYLNYEYFKNRELNSFKTELCKKGPDANISLEKILINLIFRSFVSDYMVRTIPYWSIIGKEKYSLCYKNPVYVDIVKKFLKSDMNRYSQGVSDTSSYIYDTLLKIAEEVYTSSSSTIFKDLVETNEDKKLEALDYYVKREMKHFIDYSLFYNIIQFSEKNIRIMIEDEMKPVDGYDYRYVKYSKVQVGETEYLYIDASLLDQNIFDVYIYPTDFDKLLTIEEQSMFAYYLMSSEINPSQAHIYANSKSSLIKILTRYLPVKENKANIEVRDNQNRINDFINKIAFSPAPEAMINLNPNYSKYVKFFLQAALHTARSQALSQATNNDLNIGLTRGINKISALGSILSWSLIPQETRQELIINSGNVTDIFFYKRLEAGKSPLPDLAVSLGIWAASVGTLPPTVGGWTYLALDSVAEAQWYEEALQEVLALKNLPGGADPCEQKRENVDSVAVNTVCTVDKQKEIVKFINSFEPEVKNI
jgi:hypothetical protein